MRIRLATEPPLPAVRAWFSFSQTATSTVLHLKKSICGLKALQDAQISPSRVRLEMDGFELLDELSVEGLLNDSELVTAVQIQIPVGTKRKASDAAIVRPAKKLKAKSSSDESSSSSNSDSSSSSESDDDSDSSSCPSVQATKPRKHPQDQPNVPPGHGSAQTRNRNLRRRVKKKFAAVAPTPDVLPPKGASQTNVIPLGTRQTDLNETPMLNMFSMGNKNKKKGYKQALAPSTTGRIVFSSPTSAPIPASISLPRFVPPSEKESLGQIPSNMFITSIDVEEGMWDRKKKKRQDPVEVEWPAFIEEPEPETVVLDYGLSPEAESGRGVSEKLWTDTELQWDGLKVVDDMNSLSVGARVAWHALALNPLTFSPEIMLQIATILQISPEAQTVTLGKLTRPGFAEDEMQEEESEETLSWTKPSL
ncbi:hypothetical protein C8J56DRAFT_906841 [Mycena floridula]|nr:hypothetical protein C8J56DRAFT_906841 [Mycena floridula]